MKMFRVAPVCSVVLLSLIVTPAQTWAADARPPIERFVDVDGRLYRGAQPDLEGFKYLRDLGIGTIINLRMPKDAERLKEREMVESLGMKYVHIPIEDGNFFTRSRIVPDEAILTFFQTIDAAAPGKVFVHCHRGADRTGALVGFYRIVRHQWDGIRAYAEAREIGMRSWYKGLRRQVEQFASHPQVALLKPSK
jgi:protein tyrosine/serine phosphatase